MKTIHELIRLHGGGEFFAGMVRLACGETGSGEPIEVEPPSKGYMPLTIEVVGSGPLDGTARIGVSHHYTQEGDVMYDPWVELLIPTDPRHADNVVNWAPCAFEMTLPPTRREVYRVDGDGKVRVWQNEKRDLASFCRTWDRNLRAQGYIRQFEKQIGACS